jgi:hypothetical protein
MWGSCNRYPSLGGGQSIPQLTLTGMLNEINQSSPFCSSFMRNLSKATWTPIFNSSPTQTSWGNLERLLLLYVLCELPTLEGRGESRFLECCIIMAAEKGLKDVKMVSHKFLISKLKFPFFGPIWLHLHVHVYFSDICTRVRIKSSVGQISLFSHSGKRRAQGSQTYLHLSLLLNDLEGEDKVVNTKSN